MRKVIRLLCGLLLLFVLGAITVDRRCRRIRQAYKVRRQLEANAVLENEISFLLGEVLAREGTSEVLRRAEELGVDVGRRRGKEVCAPPLAVDGGQ